MNKREIEQLVVRQAAAWRAADLDAIVADFAPDATFISPGGTWRGPTAIASAARDFFATCSAVEIEITRVLVDGNQGAVEWTWTETRRADEQTVSMEDAIVFELREGEIVYWREYFVPA